MFWSRNCGSRSTVMFFLFGNIYIYISPLIRMCSFSVTVQEQILDNTVTSAPLTILRRVSLSTVTAVAVAQQKHNRVSAQTSCQKFQTILRYLHSLFDVLIRCVSIFAALRDCLISLDIVTSAGRKSSKTLRYLVFYRWYLVLAGNKTQPTIFFLQTPFVEIRRLNQFKAPILCLSANFTHKNRLFMISKDVFSFLFWHAVFLHWNVLPRTNTYTLITKWRYTLELI